MFSQIEKIEAEQLVQYRQHSLHQLPMRRMEVMVLAEPIFLVAQASISILPNCQPWVTGTPFPSTSILIPNLIIQPMTNNQVAREFPVETAIVNITNGSCPLLFFNNKPNNIKLQPNQLISITKHMLESVSVSNDLSIAATASIHNLTDHEPAALDKSSLHHTDKQKLDFALNKMTQKTHVTAAQKGKALVCFGKT
uniref:Uncharacterized protein n=1 Tax=Romanomermis culicivorax TaxID=13658 RepID=A0A915IZF3_ROMCU